MNSWIDISDSALVELKKLAEKENEEKSLRIGVKSGGCSGFSYIMDFDKESENDIFMEVEGLKLIVNKSQAIYLQGIRLNYDSGLNNRGFIFENPNASSTCGCGESFAI